MRSLFLGCLCTVVVQSSDVGPTTHVKPYWQHPPQGFAEHWGHAPVPQKPRRRRIIAPYRLATKASVSLVFAFLAWRMASLRDYLAAEKFVTVRLMAMLVWANVVSCFLVQMKPRLLKAVLLADSAVELHLFLASLWRAFRHPDKPPLPAGLASVWFGMLAFSVVRSKWISGQLSKPEDDDDDDDRRPPMTFQHYALPPHSPEPQQRPPPPF